MQQLIVLQQVTWAREIGGFGSGGAIVMGGGPGSGGRLAVEWVPEEQLPDRPPKRIDYPRARERLVCFMCTRLEAFGQDEARGEGRRVQCCWNRREFGSKSCGAKSGFPSSSGSRAIASADLRSKLKVSSGGGVFTKPAVQNYVRFSPFDNLKNFTFRKLLPALLPAVTTYRQRITQAHDGRRGRTAPQRDSLCRGGGGRPVLLA